MCSRALSLLQVLRYGRSLVRVSYISTTENALAVRGTRE